MSQNLIWALKKKVNINSNFIYWYALSIIYYNYTLCMAFLQYFYNLSVQNNLNKLFQKFNNLYAESLIFFKL